MKMTKRIFSLALCLVLMLALALPAMAADETYTLTIHNANEGHKYEAYQIFTGDLLDKDNVQTLSTIQWGSAIVNGTSYDKSAALLAAIKEEPKLNVLHAADNAATLATLLGGVSSDSATLDLFAEVVGKVLKADPKSVFAASSAGVQIGSVYDYTISGLHAGYYLVKDEDDSLDGDNDVATKYILRVVKDIAVTAKGSVPTVDKTVNDTIDGTFGEHEDADIGDTMYYKWVGTLPSNLNSYEGYFYKFHDTLSEGLKFQDVEQIYIEDKDGKVVHTFIDRTDADTANDTRDGIEITSDDLSVTVEFDNLQTMYLDADGKSLLLPTDKIVVKYSAMITRDAEIGTSIANKVVLEFSNDPQGDGTGKTPEDYAFVFTFGIDVDKYDADNDKKKLENAKFVLYYERIENVGGKDTVVKHYAMVITEEMIADGKEINGKVVTDADLGVVYEWTTDKDEASILDTDANGYLGVRGLDAGIFYLEETEAPAGYNLMETPVMIEIIPSYTVGETTATVNVSYKVDSVPQSSNTVGVRNSAGSTLPVTGGVGTTMFYVVGGLLIAAAAVMLISKRRVEE